MNHFALPRFWSLYRQLPKEIQKLADKNYQLLLADPSHPSLHFKRIKSGARELWSVRESTDGIIWFWIGSHSDYDKLINT